MSLGTRKNITDFFWRLITHEECHDASKTTNTSENGCIGPLVSGRNDWWFELGLQEGHFQREVVVSWFIWRGRAFFGRKKTLQELVIIVKQVSNVPMMGLNSFEPVKPYEDYVDLFCTCQYMDNHHDKLCNTQVTKKSTWTDFWPRIGWTNCSLSGHMRFDVLDMI